MAGVVDEHGIVHLPSDGPSLSRTWALCDVLDLELPPRNWDHEEVRVDLVPTCIRCLGLLRSILVDDAPAKA